MLNPFSLVNETVKKISFSEKQKTKKIFLFKQKKNDFFSRLPEKRIAFKVKKRLFNASIAGIDSGFDAKNMYSADIVLVKVAGCIFFLENGLLKKTVYYPSFPVFRVHVSSKILQNEDLPCNKSLVRLKEEMEGAINLVKKYKPEYLLLDGSLVLQHADKPGKESGLKPFYKEVLTVFEELYETAEKNNTVLIGCIKDSRGTRFVSLLKKASGLNQELEVMDSVFLDYFLEEGERTTAFSYIEEVKKHPVLRDFNTRKMSDLRVLYLKPSTLDRVIRIEFFSKKKDLTKTADLLASLILSLSSSHREFAFPTPLIEADLRARLNGKEINMFYDKILDKLGRTFKLQLRRNSKPF